MYCSYISLPYLFIASSGGGGHAPVMSPSKGVQFFSVAGGTAAPVQSMSGGPPQQMQPPSSGQYNTPNPNSMMGMNLPPPSSLGPGAPFSQQQMQPPQGGGMMGAPPPGGQFMPASSGNMMAGSTAPGFMTGGNTLSANQLDGVGGGAGLGLQLPGIEDMDLSIQCDPRFMRCTVSKLVNSQALAAASKLPLGVICRPMSGDIGTSNDCIPVVDFGQTGIVRCKRCRTYINPYVSWVENGRRWRCNLCGMLNDVPTSYFSHLDQSGQRRDKDQRPELSQAAVEFIAPEDYMVRPPQPPVYFFVIDVSSTAGSSGMLQSCVKAIRNSLSSLPGSSRTLFGLITFDSNIHFYNLKSSLKAPQMLVVSDLVDPSLPLPEDLLVNLLESRDVIESLLDALPSKPSFSSYSSLTYFR